MRVFILWIVVALVSAQATCAFAEPRVVRLEGAPGKWQLTRDGKPYFVRGAGGDGSWELLARCGGNSIRTWGPDHLERQLDEAERLGLSIAAGIWLGQVRQGFDWSDAASLMRQREMVRQVVTRYKNHPALLIWSLGNEMEDGEGKNGAVWSEINHLARLVKSLDPNHPTMTVIAEMGGEKIRNLHALCPDLDLVGINSYGGATSVGERYRKLGGTKPFLLTEFGPLGIWEVQKNEIGAYSEPSSTAKVERYRSAYQQTVLGQPGKCLGSYAFVWGQKQEVTPTWFSLLLHDGSRLGAVDALTEFWSGRAPENRVPEINSLALDGSDVRPAAAGVSVRPGTTVRLSLKSSDPEGDRLTVTWQLIEDNERYGTGGDPESAGAAFASAIKKSDTSHAEIELPNEGGLYRVFATVRDGHGGAAVANIPIRVEGPVRLAQGKKVTLPFVLYDEAETNGPYAPSGWMGDTKSIKLDPACATEPHSGKTCLRCEFTATNGWGGVVWQHPAQDWGEQRGGFDLTGAKKLVFFARGEQGGEEVSLGFGILGPEKKYFDTARRMRDKISLTPQWQRFEIPLDDLKSGENLTRIKSGFVWTLASPGKPVVFYLDDIRWE